MKYGVDNQKLKVVARDASGLKVSGDAANITATIAIDGGAPAATADVNPTEIGTSGEYEFTLTASEVTGYALNFQAESATGSVVEVEVVPDSVIYTTREDSIYTQTSLIGSNAATVPVRLSATTLSLYVSETQDLTVTTPDYTSVTLVITFKRKDTGATVATVADGSITKSATYITFSIPAAVTAQAWTLDWSLRSTTGNEVLTAGDCVVYNAA